MSQQLTVESLYERERDAVLRRDYTEARECAERRIRLVEAMAKPPVQLVHKPKVAPIPERLREKWRTAQLARVDRRSA